MSTAGLPSILGEGDEAAWKKMLEHPNSFLFAVVNAGGDVESLHELMWQRRKPRATPSGALGWVICVQNSATGAPLPKGYCFRVHICRQTPCTAVYPPAKYGDTPAPLRHGHMVKLCDAAEEVNIEASWKLVTAEHSRPECSEELTPKTVESANSFKSPTETAGSVAMIAGDAADTKTGFGCTNSLPSSPVGEAIDSAAPGAAIHAGEPENEQEVAPAVVAIRARADEISVPGNWIGMLEVMAFCAVHKRRVVLQLEDGTVDVMSSLVPMLMDSTWNLAPFEGHLVACKLVGSVWHPATFATCTHFVATKPLREKMQVPGDGVVAVMARLGFATIMTTDNGDCGIESLLVLCNARRGQVERNALRRQLQTFMHSVSTIPAWHDAFLAAGEILPDNQPPAVVSSAVAEAPHTNDAIAESSAVAEKEKPASSEPQDAADAPSSAGKNIMPCDLVAADEKDPVLRAAVAWPDGLKKPSAAFLTRMTASLSESEGRQLLQAHEASCKAIIAQDTTGAKFGLQKRRSVLLTYKLGLCKAFLDWMAQRGLSDGKSMPCVCSLADRTRSSIHSRGAIELMHLSSCDADLLYKTRTKPRCGHTFLYARTREQCFQC